MPWIGFRPRYIRGLWAILEDIARVRLGPVLGWGKRKGQYTDTLDMNQMSWHETSASSSFRKVLTTKNLAKFMPRGAQKCVQLLWHAKSHSKQKSPDYPDYLGQNQCLRRHPVAITWIAWVSFSWAAPIDSWVWVGCWEPSSLMSPLVVSGSYFQLSTLVGSSLR